MFTLNHKSGPSYIAYLNVDCFVLNWLEMLRELRLLIQSLATGYYTNAIAASDRI